jgi:hypothetical protein
VRFDRADKVGKENKRKEKEKKIKIKKRVLRTIRPFVLPGEAVLPNGPKNCFSSPGESAPPLKPQLKLFWLEPELYQTGP